MQKKALHYSTRLGDEVGISTDLLNLAIATQGCGDHTEATRLFKVVLQRLGEAGDEILESKVRDMLTMAYMEDVGATLP